MAKPNNIVIIGGTACGPKAASRARRCDPAARITLIEQGEDLSQATCGLPYYISGVITSRDAMTARQPDFFRDVLNIEALTRTRAIAVDCRAHQIELLDRTTNQSTKIGYDKLVLATGSVPAVPDLPGSKLNGIFTVTGIEEADALRSVIATRQIKRVAILGAGLIGLEMAEAFVSRGLEVTIFEALDRVLPALLDFEVAAYLDRHLADKGVNRRFGQRVTGFEGDRDGWVRRVSTADTEMEADLVLLAIGTKPNTELARNAGLAIGATGGIAVNPYLQTSDPDIYAGGDCVENVHRLTGRKVLAALGSTAGKQGRVIGSNVTGGRETFPGVLDTAIVKVFDYNVARVGLSESQSRDTGYDVVTSLVSGQEHAAYYPRGREILVKLVAEKSSGRLLGGQVVGPGEAAKRVDVLATALTFGATVDDLANLDLAYAPPYNNAFDPLHHAANVIRNKQSGFARALPPMAVKDKLENGDDFILLDVRSPGEWQKRRIEAPQVRLLPLGELRRQLDTLSRDAEIVIFCRSSVRAYQAQRILDGAGYKNVKFMDGSLVAWPYEIWSDQPR